MRVIEQIESRSPYEDSLRVWYLGANSLVLQSASARLYVDPFLVPAALHDGQFRRREDPSVTASEVNLVDGILITHEHKDHCNPYTLHHLLSGRSVPVIAPQVSARIVGDTANQARVRVVRPSDRVKLAEFDIEVCRSGDTVAINAVSFLIRYRTLTLYVAGDALFLRGLLPGIDRKLDVAFLPIATNPPGQRFYLSAPEWVEMARQLAPRYVVPVHWDVWADYYVDPAVLTQHRLSENLRIVPVSTYLDVFPTSAPNKAGYGVHK